MPKKYFVLDVICEDCIKKNAITVESISALNQWIAFYVNDGKLPFVREVESPEPYFEALI